MADNPFNLSNLGQMTADGDSSLTPKSKIGDLRRRYNFGASVSELAIDQTPFFRFILKLQVKQLTTLSLNQQKKDIAFIRDMLM